MCKTSAGSWACVRPAGSGSGARRPGAPAGVRGAARRCRMTGELDVQDIGGLMGVREAGRIGVVLAGTVRPAGWNVPEVEAGFFEAKGLVERLGPGGPL